MLFVLYVKKMTGKVDDFIYYLLYFYVSENCAVVTQIFTAI